MDRLAKELTRLGYAVTPTSLYRDGYTGYHVALGDAELAYRIEPDDVTVIIPWYHGPRRRGASLRNAFAEFEWFLSFLARPDSRLKRVRGMIRAAPPNREGAPSLPTERISEFYRRLLGGRTLAWEGGEEWLYLDLQEYRPRRRPPEPPSLTTRGSSA
jgi:hypothetical protein